MLITSIFLLLLTSKGQVIDGGKVKPLYWYVGDNTSTSRDGEITCMEENAAGDRLYAGKVTEASLVDPPLTGFGSNKATAFLGLKKAGVHAFDDPQAWQWAVYFENGLGDDRGMVDFCFWTPSAIGAPYNKQMFVFAHGSKFSETGPKHRYYMNDPADATTGTYKTLRVGLS